MQYMILTLNAHDEKTLRPEELKFKNTEVKAPIAILCVCGTVELFTAERVYFRGKEAGCIFVLHYFQAPAVLYCRTMLLALCLEITVN